jgi:hypothetical protein
MQDKDENIGVEYTVVLSECGSWYLMVSPEKEITYIEFLKAIRSFLNGSPILSEDGPGPNDIIC